jgi:hypothetical protein
LFSRLLSFQEATFQKLDLDQFVMAQGGVGFPEEGSGDLAFTDCDHGLEIMSQAPQVSFLFSRQHGVSSSVSVFRHHFRRSKSLDHLTPNASLSQDQ